VWVIIIFYKVDSQRPSFVTYHANNIRFLKCELVSGKKFEHWS
jgi:hypothetical protein